MACALPADRWRNLPPDERAAEIGAAGLDRFLELQSIARQFHRAFDGELLADVRDVPGWGQLAQACADAFEALEAAFAEAPWALAVESAKAAVAPMRPAAIQRRKERTTAKRLAVEARYMADWEAGAQGVYEGRLLALARDAARANAALAGARAVKSPGRRMRALREACKAAVWARDTFEEKVAQLLGPHLQRAVTDAEIQVAEDAAWQWLAERRAKMAAAKAKGAR